MAEMSHVILGIDLWWRMWAGLQGVSVYQNEIKICMILASNSTNINFKLNKYSDEVYSKNIKL